MSGRSRRKRRYNSTGAAASWPREKARVAWRRGWWAMPSATSPATKGPGADAVWTSWPASRKARSCGPRSSSRLMSVVVTCSRRDKVTSDRSSPGLDPGLQVLDVIGDRDDPPRVEHVGSVGHDEVEVEVAVVGEHDDGVGGPQLLGGERDQLDADRQRREGDVGIDDPDVGPEG